MNCNDTIKEIKQRFHLRMDGVASASMREKGADYKINWGLKFPDIKEIANDFRSKDEEENYRLAIELWKEQTRECRILATLLMPKEKFAMDLAQLWAEQLGTQEIAEYLAFNLLQHTADAATLAFQWIAGNDELRQICGYTTLGGLFSQGREPELRDMQELLDQAVTAILQKNKVSRSAMNCLNKLADLNESYEEMVDKIFHHSLCQLQEN